MIFVDFGGLTPPAGGENFYMLDLNALSGWITAFQINRNSAVVKATFHQRWWTLTKNSVYFCKWILSWSQSFSSIPLPFSQCTHSHLVSASHSWPFTDFPTLETLLEDHDSPEMQICQPTWMSAYTRRTCQEKRIEKVQLQRAFLKQQCTVRDTVYVQIPYDNNNHDHPRH